MHKICGAQLVPHKTQVYFECVCTLCSVAYVSTYMKATQFYVDNSAQLQLCSVPVISIHFSYDAIAKTNIVQAE